MADWQQDDVIANGIKTHFWRTGGDKPALVLAHGATDNALCWSRVARALESEYDVIMPDARAHGLTEGPAGNQDYHTRADDLAGLIRALGLDKPAIGGHSMGAQSAFYLLVKYPGLARCAILEDPVFMPRDYRPTEAEKNSFGEWVATLLRERKGQTREQMMAGGRVRHPGWAVEEYGPWADAKLQLNETFVPGSPPNDLAWWKELPKVTEPILLVTSDPDKGSIVTPEVAAEAARLQPKLKVVRLEGAGHNIRRERFDGFVQAVRDFLRAG